MNNEIDVILSKHLISLDDIGTEEVSVKYGNRRQAFAEIVDAAEKYGKLLVISTNLDKTAIVEKYGERVFDRLVAVTKRVEFKGKSLRK
jgi:DNA replication protein DnaC